MYKAKAATEAFQTSAAGSSLALINAAGRFRMKLVLLFHEIASILGVIWFLVLLAAIKVHHNVPNYMLFSSVTQSIYH
jgi:hypothetical protein